MNFWRKGKNSASATPYDDERPLTAHTETTEQHQRMCNVTENATESSRQTKHFLFEGKKALNKTRQGIRILLLGQAESGKVRILFERTNLELNEMDKTVQSCVLKNFQSRFAPKQYQSQRRLWKIIIHLNIIGSIKTIFDALEKEYERENDRQVNDASMSVYQRARLGLSLLKAMEANILAFLAPEYKDSCEMVVRSGSGWKTLLQSTQSPFSAGSNGPILGVENDPSPVLIAQKDDIKALWLNDEVQRILSRRHPQLRQSPGFFLDDISRVLTPDYVPTDHDILRANIRTMGVEEHHFFVEKGAVGPTVVDYYVIDVGGSRSQRASWKPFLNEVNAIVFLAPLVFNKFLDEDNKINCMEDSMLLWKEICDNKLLDKVHIVLLFSKMDILAATLRGGTQVKEYILSYKNLPNELSHVTKYFRNKFRDVHRRYSPGHRPFFCHETSVTVTNSTYDIMSSIGDSLLRQKMRSQQLL